MIRVTGLRVRLEDDEPDLRSALASYLCISREDVLSAKILRRAVDARKKSQIYLVYTIDAAISQEAESSDKIAKNTAVSALVEEHPTASRYFGALPGPRPVVVGTGPAGLFAALVLAGSGVRPLVLERGAVLEKRVNDVNRFWEGMGLDPESNVQFGEGGAGTFSDGKLTTRINDPRVRTVLRTLVDMGAPAEILYEAKPHVGTDRLRAVVLRFRKRLVELGAEVRFGARVEGIITNGGTMAGLVVGGERVEASHVILAPGNAARDTFAMLMEAGVALSPKSFAIGVRVEHPREHIDRIQYGRYAGHPKLGAADYMLTYNDRRTGRAAYTFCMCPGGMVVGAASMERGVVVNGMSDYSRDAACSNSAIVVTVSQEDFGAEGPLGGVRFQERWEREAYMLGGGGYVAPAQDMLNFMKGAQGGDLGLASYRPGVSPADLSRCLPAFVTDAIRNAIPSFDSKMKGFMHPHAVLTGVETRTSSPVRILRGEDFQSVSVRGLYPCGEGSGYAGGIVSSAVDGIKAAEKLIETVASS